MNDADRWIIFRLSLWCLCVLGVSHKKEVTLLFPSSVSFSYALAYSLLCLPIIENQPKAFLVQDILPVFNQLFISHSHRHYLSVQVYQS